MLLLKTLCGASGEESAATIFSARKMHSVRLFNLTTLLTTLLNICFLVKALGIDVIDDNFFLFKFQG